MDAKTLKEYQLQRTVQKLSGKNVYFKEFWEKLTMEQRFELGIMEYWSKHND